MIKTTILFCLVVLAACQDSSNDDERIVNGQEINISQAPYMVQIRRSGNLHCGGSLIASNYVITAAHCVHGFDLRTFVIVSGATSITETGIQRTVARYTIHPEYNPQTMHTDIAIFQLNDPIPNARVLALCDQPPIENEYVQVSGWGKMGENLGMSRNLRSVMLPVRDHQSCVNEFAHYVKQNMFCLSGYQAVGSCQGDSGGPAVYKGQVCGLVAFAYRCGTPGYLSAFTNVHNLVGFVRQFMSGR